MDFILEGRGRYEVRVSRFWISKTHCLLHSLQRFCISKTHRVSGFCVSGLPSNGSHINPIVRNSVSKKQNSAIDAIPGLDFQKGFRAKQFLLRNRDSTILFLEAKEEDKMKVLEMVLPDGMANQ
ncbi:uncharacterized protein LOC122090801 [Macadamia integrifolia]|uniref:uncharacterized protein LOC122090801 n=1 Tax=Macadamia integrifolia TaxID=60698 RepID=UPI001C4FE233|nr:uncharacterized protein LOC122090801 [Macadamia integrifolia]